MLQTVSNSFWHPFAAMGSVAGGELVIERGQDVWVYDSDGNRLLDATASLWYCNVGHGRTEIADAVAAQMQRIETYSAFGELASPPALALAERLARVAPMAGAKVFLATGGGEAVDTAAKLARRYWSESGSPQRQVLIHREGSYHGTNGYGTSLAGIPANRQGFGELMPGTVQVARDSAQALEEAIERLGPERVAAFFVEPVIGVGGVHPPSEGYIERVAEICARGGVLMIADSVICAFGRLGTWFGIERWPVSPDMICFAKGVTSGYLPLSGLIVSGRVAEPFFCDGAPPFRHGATYAGHATCCAAALANLDILEGEGLIARGRELETELIGALGSLSEHPLVAEVRGGTGLMAAVELSPALLQADPGALAAAVRTARGHGVLVRALGSCLAVSPPLTATGEHFAMIADAVGHALAELQRSHPGVA